MRVPSRESTALCKGRRLQDFWNGGPPRLLRSLERNALPSLHPLLGSFGEMGLGAIRNDRNDSKHAQLDTLLDGPLHAIEFEDGEDYGQSGSRIYRNDFAELELDSIVRDAGDATAADALTRCDVKFLPDPSAKHLREVLGVCAD